MGKNKPKSQKAVEKEIKALKEMKPFVRQFTAFGDNNHDKIDGQIKALEEMGDEEEADDEWVDEADNEIRMNACDAIRWKNGEDDGAQPSRNWASLDSRKKAKKS